MAQDLNKVIIDEFRANRGKVGGQFAGAPLLILHIVGAVASFYRSEDGHFKRRIRAHLPPEGGRPRVVNGDWESMRQRPEPMQSLSSVTAPELSLALAAFDDSERAALGIP